MVWDGCGDVVPAVVGMAGSARAVAQTGTVGGGRHRPWGGRAVAGLCEGGEASRVDARMNPFCFFGRSLHYLRWHIDPSLRPPQMNPKWVVGSAFCRPPTSLSDAEQRQMAGAICRPGAASSVAFVE